MPLTSVERGRPAATRPAARLRIAFLGYRSDPRVGGQGVFLSQAAHALARRGHRVDVISGPPYPDLDRSGGSAVEGEVNLIRLPSLDLYAQPHNGHRALRWRHLLSWTDTAEFFGHWSGVFMEPWSFGRRAARYLRAHCGDYDVVIDNQSLSDGLLAIRALGLPLVEVVHHPIRRDLEYALAADPRPGMQWLKRRWYGFLKMQERVAPRLDHIVVVSEASRRDIARCLKVREAAMTVVPLGVDAEIFRPRPDIPRAPARLLTTASADVPLKGLAYLLEAYAALLATRPELELLVIGRLREGPTVRRLEALGLAGKVRFVSDLSAEAMARAYAEATICVTPSLYEGFGLPAAEAMACGAAVVVTDGGALPEVVGDAGVIVPAADAAALAVAIGALLDDPDRRAELGRRGLARARSLFSWDRVGEAYEAILQRAIAAP